MSWLEKKYYVSFSSFSCLEVALLLFVFALFLVTDGSFGNKSFLSAVARRGMSVAVVESNFGGVTLEKYCTFTLLHLFGS